MTVSARHSRQTLALDEKIFGPDRDIVLSFQGLGPLQLAAIYRYICGSFRGSSELQKVVDKSVMWVSARKGVNF